MNEEFKNWLDKATAGLPVELQVRVRGELEGHYRDALADSQREGKTSLQAHAQALDALGNAADTAYALRRTHLATRRHLVTGIGLCLVAVWYVLNNGSLSPNAWTSGSLRIIAGAGVFGLFMGMLWLVRDFLTRQLGLSSLRLALDMELIGWGLMIAPFLRAVILMKISVINELLMTEYPVLQTRIFQVAEGITTVGSLLVSAGLLLMAWRLARVKANLYGAANLLKWVAVITGLLFAYGFAGQMLNFLGVNFIIQSGPGEATQIGLITRQGAPDSAVWLTSGVDWLHGLGLFVIYSQIALLGIMAFMFLRAYWQNTVWLRQAA